MRISNKKYRFSNNTIHMWHANAICIVYLEKWLNYVDTGVHTITGNKKIRAYQGIYDGSLKKVNYKEVNEILRNSAIMEWFLSHAYKK